MLGEFLCHFAYPQSMVLEKDLVCKSILNRDILIWHIEVSAQVVRFSPVFRNFQTLLHTQSHSMNHWCQYDLFLKVIVKSIWSSYLYLSSSSTLYTTEAEYQSPCRNWFLKDVTIPIWFFRNNEAVRIFVAIVAQVKTISFVCYLTHNL